MTLLTRFGTPIIAMLLVPGVAAAQETDERDTAPPMQDRDIDREVPRRDRVTDRAPRRRNQAQAQRFVAPPDLEFVPDVVYATVANDDGSTKELMMNVLFPKDSGTEPLPAIVYIHGGGWESGTRDAGNQASAVLARGGYLTATISYRLVGEAKFPACMEDCKAAIRFLRANADELGIDADRIGVWGHSAGGHLAAYLGTTGNAPETAGDVGAFADVSSSVACVVDYFGPTDLGRLFGGRGADRVRSRLFREITDDQYESLIEAGSPIRWIDEDDPPVLILHGTEDRLVPLEQSETFAQALEGAGVEVEFIVVEGAGHGIRDPEYLISTAIFFDRHLGGAAQASTEEAVARMVEEQRLREDRARAQQERRRARQRQTDQVMDEDDAGDGG